VSRRVSLPAADDLFRTTRHARELRERGSTAREMAALLGRVEPVDPAYTQVRPAAEPASETAAAPVEAAFTETAAETAARKSSGRVRHDEKMTVYVTAGELLDIEHARLSLRRDQGLAVDRGRLVREAIAIALEDLEENGDDSVLVQRLIGR
jgi:uncharacterized protein YndB with AHSA1/START domain